jgi:uncharacterized protein YceK
MPRAMHPQFLTVATLCMLSGCGTCFNYLGADKAGPRPEQQFGRPYGGLQFELQAARSLFVGDCSSRTQSIVPFNIETISAASLLAVDMPLTLVGDTLTLPFTLYYTLKCHRLAQAQSQSNPEPVSESDGGRD